MLIEEQIESSAKIFLQAAQNGNVFLFKALLEPLLCFPHVIANTVDSECGGNALHWVALQGPYELVVALIEKLPELIDLQTSNGSTPILNAIVGGQGEIAQYLAQKNANLMITNKNNKNAFSAALQSEHPGIKQYFRSYRDTLNNQFISAVHKNELEDVRECLNRGADIEIPVRGDGANYTALFHACSTDNENLARLLIEHRANLNVIGAKNGFSPLHSAVFFRHESIAKLLKDAGANGAIKDSNGYTPLQFAREQNIPEMIDLLQPKPRNPELVRYTKSNVPLSLLSHTTHEEISINTLRSELDLLSSHIQEIKKEVQQMNISDDEFQEYEKAIEGSIQFLINAFKTKDISDITDQITRDCKWDMRIHAITNQTDHMLRTLRIHVPMIQNSRLADLMIRFKGKTSKFNKKISDIHDGKIKIIAESLDRHGNDGPPWERLAY